MKILVADDHELFGELIKTVIETEAKGASVQAYRNFDDAFAAVATRRVGQSRNFDLVLLDMRMPGMNGLTGLRRMIDIADGAPVAIMSGMLSPAEAREALREGAAGFLPKTMQLAELSGAIQQIMMGQRYVPKFLMVKDQAESVAPRAGGEVALSKLTVREQEVLTELMQGWSNKRIAENLGITEFTVKSHMMHLFQKIGAKNRTDAVRIAVKLKQATGTPTDSEAGDKQAVDAPAASERGGGLFVG